MKAKIGIKDENAASVAEILNKMLADEHVLYLKTRNAHWNVEGPDFHAMHIFFEEQYTELALMIDAIAERIRTIGQYAVATMKDYLKMSDLQEYGKGANTSHAYITALLRDHESIIVGMRNNISPIEEELNDAGTSDFVNEMMQKHETMAWMLRAHLAK